MKKLHQIGGRADGHSKAGKLPAAMTPASTKPLTVQFYGTIAEDIRSALLMIGNAKTFDGTPRLSDETQIFVAILREARRQRDDLCIRFDAGRLAVGLS